MSAAAGAGDAPFDGGRVAEAEAESASAPGRAGLVLLALILVAAVANLNLAPAASARSKHGSRWLATPAACAGDFFTPNIPTTIGATLAQRRRGR